MKTPKRITLAFTPEIQLGLLEEQASFHVNWHEPAKRKPWGAFIRRIFLLEIALNEKVKLKEVTARWPDFAWQNCGVSTLGRWMLNTRKDYKKLPAQSKAHLRALARWHFDVPDRERP